MQVKMVLCIGDLNGYYTFFPDKVKTNPIPPKIVFTGLGINGKMVIPGSNSPLEVPIEQAKKIILNYDQNNISIDFAGIHYSSPEYNRHRYMLENLDTNWHETYSQKTASYFNVQPGEYIFRVKATNSDGVESEKDLKIIINPPWWKSGWAYGLFGLAVLSCLFMFDRIQRKRIISRERENNRKIEIAHAKEIEKAYNNLKTTQTQLIQSEKMASLGELTAGIAHEIQNPLNFVNNFSEVNKELIHEALQSIKTGNSQAAALLLATLEENEDKIIHHGRRADAIVKGMLQHSRASTGQKELTNINAVADECLRLSYHALRAKDKSFKATLKTDFDENIGNIPLVPQDIVRVFVNLFNNGFYATWEKAKEGIQGYEATVSVMTKKVNTKVEVRIKDNGNGIPQKVFDKIFQPFFTTKPAGQGTGLGLSMSYDIIKAHGGEIKVETKQGEGTDFVVELPINKA
jgi:signal transduction histidine kinase